MQLGKDPMDVLELIKADHLQVENLFSEIGSTDDTHKLYQCFNKLYNELNVHAEVEEQTFYPAIRRCQGTEKLVDVAQDEHEEARQMLEELASLSPTSVEFKQKISELRRIIQHHVQSEENEVFSRVRDCMSEEARSQLGSEFQAVKSRVQSEMSVAS